MSHITKAKSTIGHIHYIRKALEDNDFDFIMVDRTDVFHGRWQNVTDVDIYIRGYVDKNGKRISTHFGLQVDETTKSLEILGDFYESGFENAEEFRKFLLKEVWKKVLEEKFPDADITINEDPDDIEIDEINDDIIEFELVLN